MAGPNASGQAQAASGQHSSGAPVVDNLPTPVTGELTGDDGMDPDELLLAQAQREVQAEDQAAQGGQPASESSDAVQLAAQAAQQAQQQQPTQDLGQLSPAPQAAPQPAVDPKGQPMPGQPGAEQITIPKERFDEAVNRARSERDQALAQAAYFQGIAEAQQAQQVREDQQRAAQPAPQRPDYDGMRVQQEAALDQAAEQLDQGAITNVQYRQVEKQVRANMKQIDDHQTLWDRQVAEQQRQQQLYQQQAQAAHYAAQQPQGQPQQQQADGQETLADRVVLEQQLVDLDQKHPYVKALTPEHVERLRAIAIADYHAQNQRVPAGSHGKYILRKKIAELSDVFGPQWFGQPPQPGQQPGQNGLSASAQARLAKAPMAAAMPPDTSQFGQRSGAPQGAIPTDAQIVAMSDDEIAALPPEVQARWLSPVNQ